MKIRNDFPAILSNYFTKHLSLERKFSENTYKNYLITLKQFIDYLENNICISRRSISICDFNKENILSFLMYVENELLCTAKTRNYKLTVINSFLEYAQSINPIYLRQYMDSKNIKLKRVVKEKMDYLTKDELETVFKAINLKHKDGYRHYVLLTVLYETATRVSELINIRVEDLFFNNESAYIKVLGKGFKERIIYINDSVVKMINEYRSKLNINDGYLFLNHSKQQMSRQGVNKIIDKYVDIAKKECPTLTHKRVSPHTFRHSKAVHFLENGTALPIIQRFLGHTSIQTTEIYLDITNEVVIDAVNTIADKITPKKREKSMWDGDDKLVALLEGLGK